MKENTFVRRTNTIRYNTASKTIELRVKNNGLALIEKALAKDGFKRRYNDDGYEVLVREWNGNKRTLNRIIKMLQDADAIDDREEKKLYIEELADRTPKRVVYPLTAAQETEGTRKPTAEELEELERIEMLADDYEFGYEAPIKKTTTTRKEVRITKKEELNTPEDFLRALAELKAMFA